MSTVEILSSPSGSPDVSPSRSRSITRLLLSSPVRTASRPPLPGLDDHKSLDALSEEDTVINSRAQAELKVWEKTDMKGKLDEDKIPSSMSGQTLTQSGRFLYLFGGYENGEALNDLWVYDTHLKTWEKVEVSGEKPNPRTSHSTLIDEENGMMYILCGSGSAFGHTNLGDIWSFDMKFRFWKKLNYSNSEILSPRYGQSAVLYKSKIYIFGGTFGREFSQETFVLDLTKNVLQRVTTYGAIPSARYKHTAVRYGSNQMLLFGGAERSNYRLNDVYMFDLDRLRWRLVRCGGDVPPGRFAHSMNVYKDKLVVFGGTDRVLCFNDMYVLDIPSRIWTKVCTQDVPVPSRRYFHASAMSESGDFYVYGGKISVEDQVRVGDMWKVTLFEPTTGKCSFAMDLLDFYEKGEMCDLEIHTKDKVTFKAHQLILKSRSSELGSLIMKELHDAKTEVKDISLSDDLLVIDLNFSSRVVEKLLIFIYSSEVSVSEDFTVDDYVHLLAGAVEFKLRRLEKICEVRIVEMLNSPKAVLRLLSLLKETGYSLPSLEVYLMTFSHIHYRHRTGETNDSPSIPSRVFGNPLQIPASSLRQDIMRLRHPLSFQSISSSSDLKKAVDVSCDFNFYFDDICISAHSVVLAARSRYFGSYAFRKGMMEGKTKECRFPSKFLVSPGAFSVLLDYIYGGEIAASCIPPAFAKEFLRVDVCNYYCFTNDHLLDICRSRLEEALQTSVEDEAVKCTIS